MSNGTWEISMKKLGGQRSGCTIIKLLPIFTSNSATLSNTAQYWDKETSAGTAAPPRGELDILDMEQLINIRDLNTPNMS